MATFSLTQALPTVAEGRSNSLQTQVAELFESARDDVYRYLLLMGVSPASAQEATQETFLRLYVTLSKGEDIREPRAWIFRVAHNFGLKLRASEHAQVYDADVERRLTSPENPEQSLLERERLGRLHKALASLSEQQRRCLFLRLEGLRYPEIGAALGISASTVGEFLRRALARLKKVTHE